jgi:hypothetical protein
MAARVFIGSSTIQARNRKGRGFSHRPPHRSPCQYIRAQDARLLENIGALSRWSSERLGPVDQFEGAGVAGAGVAGAGVPVVAGGVAGVVAVLEGASDPGLNIITSMMTTTTATIA